MKKIVALKNKEAASAENVTIVNSYYCSSESELFLELFKLLNIKLNRQFFRNVLHTVHLSLTLPIFNELV